MLRLLNSAGEITLLGNKPCWGCEFPLGKNSLGFNLVKIDLAGEKAAKRLGLWSGFVLFKEILWAAPFGRVLLLPSSWG